MERSPEWSWRCRSGWRFHHCWPPQSSRQWRAERHVRPCYSGGGGGVIPKHSVLTLSWLVAIPEYLYLRETATPELCWLPYSLIRVNIAFACEGTGLAMYQPDSIWRSGVLGMPVSPVLGTPSAHLLLQQLDLAQGRLDDLRAGNPAPLGQVSANFPQCLVICLQDSPCPVPLIVPCQEHRSVDSPTG